MIAAIVWVEAYKGRQVSLALSREDVTGFVKGLDLQHPLEWGDANAFDALFEPPTPAAVERAHIVYFAGHGSQDGAVFQVANQDNGIASYKQMKLGTGGRLLFAVFDCCLVLKRTERWKKVFQGLHYMLGFGGDIRPSDQRGKIFSEHLLAGSTLPEAWRLAAVQTEGHGVPWKSIRAASHTGTTDDEVWPQADPPSNSLDAPLVYVSVTETVERMHLEQIPPEEIRRLRLYRTPRSGQSAALLAEISGKLGPVPAESISSENWFGLRGADSLLKLSRRTDSIWWSHPRPPGRRFFEAPQRTPLASEQAIGAAAAFLERLELVADRASLHSSLHSISITEETHENLDTSQKDSWIIARHVNYAIFLDGLPLFGPGAKWRITFESNEVDEFFRFWREPEADELVDILSREEAEHALRSDPSFTQIDPRQIELHHWRVGYLALEHTLDQDYLLPVYMFEGVATTPSLEYNFIRYVQAVPKVFRDSKPIGSVFRLPAVLA